MEGKPSIFHLNLLLMHAKEAKAIASDVALEDGNIIQYNTVLEQIKRTAHRKEFSLLVPKPLEFSVLSRLLSNGYTVKVSGDDKNYLVSWHKA
jgi:hypothetical protein